jgi:hypothetical protein
MISSRFTGRLAAAAITAAIAAASAAPLAAQAFEGRMTLSLSTPTLQSESTVFMKGQSFKSIPRAEAAGAVLGVEGGYPIVDFKAQKLYVVSPKDRYYMTLPLSQLTGPIDKVAVKVKRSGRTDVMVGHPVEEWVLDDPSVRTQAGIWATADLKPGFNFLLSLQKSSPVDGLLLGRMAKVLVGQGVFPLAAWVRDASGASTIEMRILSMEPGAVPDAEVAVPSGYAKMSDTLKRKK